MSNEEKMMAAIGVMGEQMYHMMKPGTTIEMMLPPKLIQTADGPPDAGGKLIITRPKVILPLGKK